MKAIVLIASALLLTTPAFAAGDPTAGEAVFKRCASCHAVGPNAVNKAGPELNELIGRHAAAVPEYKYSEPLKAKAAEGLVWTAETLTPFLVKPKEFIPGTKMAFPGLNKPEDVENLIAYLATFTTAPAPAADAAPAAPAAQ